MSWFCLYMVHGLVPPGDQAIFNTSLRLQDQPWSGTSVGLIATALGAAILLYHFVENRAPMDAPDGRPQARVQRARGAGGQHALSNVRWKKFGDSRFDASSHRFSYDSRALDLEARRTKKRTKTRCA